MIRVSDSLIKSYHDPADEPVAAPLPPRFFEFDDGQPLGKEELKRKPNPGIPSRLLYLMVHNVLQSSSLLNALSPCSWE